MRTSIRQIPIIAMIFASLAMNTRLFAAPADDSKAALPCIRCVKPVPPIWSATTDKEPKARSAIKKIRALYGKEGRFGEKWRKIYDAIYPYIFALNAKPDDRALGVIRICYGQAIEELCIQEAKAIAASECPCEKKIREIDKLDRSISGIPSLADGFKSSIGVELSFIQVEIKQKTECGKNRDAP